jgi:hypothetical protein
MSKIRSLLGASVPRSVSNLSAELRRKAFLSNADIRFDDYAIQVVPVGTFVYTITNVNHARYRVVGDSVDLSVSVLGTTSGVAGTAIRLSLPETAWGATAAVGALLSEGQGGQCRILDGTETKGLWRISYNQNFVEIQRHDAANWGLGTGRAILLNLSYMKAM